MKSKFIKLWKKIGAKSNPFTEYNKLDTLYSKKRHYHNLIHIRMCLNELNFIKKQKNTKYDFDSIELAIWYHDIIYDPKMDNNEEKSAEYVTNVLKNANLSIKIINKVEALILSTKHNCFSRKKDERLLQDIDICIFGQSRKIFEKYEKNIRKEYSWVPLKKYKEGRLKVLCYFLNKPNIYNTKIFRKKYEQKARNNLKRSIQKYKN